MNFVCPVSSASGPKANVRAEQLTAGKQTGGTDLLLDPTSRHPRVVQHSNRTFRAVFALIAAIRLFRSRPSEGGAPSPLEVDC